MKVLCRSPFLRFFKFPGIFFGLGIYVGGHLTLIRPLFDSLHELEISRTTVEQTTSRLAKVQKDLEKCHAKSDSSFTTVRSISDPTTTEYEESQLFCSQLQTPWGVPAATGIIATTMDRILASSTLPGDVPESFTKQLWMLVAHRLPNSVKSLVRGDKEWNKVLAILEKANRRVQYLQQKSHPNNKDVPPPVKILVMGGSVTRGTNCQVHGMSRFDCAWPNRLENLVNQYLGFDIVEVKVVGIGGSNSASGAAILRDELLRSDAQHADVLIHHYATNDMHVMSMQEAKEGNITLGQRVLDMSQNFVRQALNVSCGPEPVLLWLDDYLGNEQSEILATAELSKSIHTLANYYGFGYISYADMFRDWVYGDTRETLFSPPGWYNQGAYRREIHPSVSGHISMAWAVAFNMLHLATTYCNLQQLMFNDRDFDIKGKPEPLPEGLPPLLTENLSLEHVSDIWHSLPASDPIDAHSAEAKDNECSQKCIFSWVSGMDLDQNNPDWIQEKFKPFLIESSGWELATAHKKIGYIPEKQAPLGSSWVLEFEKVDQPIRSVTVFTMKSYGPKWEGSRIEIGASSSQNGSVWLNLFKQTIEGEHNKHTSEMFPYSFNLDVPRGESLRIKATLRGGAMFKIMGIAVCS